MGNFSPNQQHACRFCGYEGATEYVEFRQIVGVFIFYFWKNVKGHLCEACVYEKFRNTTMLTLFFGWWSLISMFITPVFLVNNILYLIDALRGIKRKEQRQTSYRSGNTME